MELEQLLAGSGVGQSHPRPALVEKGSGAAGAAVVFAVPGAVEWELLLASFTLTASGAVANRFPRLDLLDQDGAVFASFQTAYKLVATNVSRVTFAPGLDSFGADSLATMGQGLPKLRLYAGLAVRLTALNMAAGDVISSPALFVAQHNIRPD